MEDTWSRAQWGSGNFKAVIEKKGCECNLYLTRGLTSQRQSVFTTIYILFCVSPNLYSYYHKKRSSDIISLIHIDYHNTFDFYVLLFKIKSMRSQQITLQQVNYPTNIPAGTIYILAISKDHKDFKKYHGNYVFHTLIQGKSV